MDCSLVEMKSEVRPELFVETVMEDPSPAEVKKTPKPRLISRIILDEERRPKKRSLPREKLPVEDLLENQNLKQLFQDVYYKSVSKDSFLKVLYETKMKDDFPFKSNLLNDYLENNKKLNVTFNIPTLYNYEKPKCIKPEPNEITVKKEVKKEVGKLPPYEIKKKTEEVKKRIETKRFYRTKSSELQKIKVEYTDDEKLLMSKYNLPKIPIIFKCENKNGKCCENPTQFRLSMVLNLGYNRPMPEEISNQYLKNELIDPMKAVIAASAVVSPSNPDKVNRIIVPVLPGSEIHEKSSKALNLFKIKFYDMTEIRQSVSKFVNDAVDFVVRQEEFLPIDYDPDVPEFSSEKKNEKCNEYCDKGCICSSLKGKVDTKHCEQVDCIFGCICHEKRKQTLRNSQNDEEVEVNGKQRRGSKAPQRYRDYVRNFSLVNPMKSLDKKRDYEPPAKKTKVENKNAPKLLGDSEILGMEWQLFKPVKEQLLDRRYKYCTGSVKERVSLGDLFIWCTIHSKYNCICPNPVVMMKHNTVLWKPTTETRYLANKVMFKIFLDAGSAFDKQASLIDIHADCSRTSKDLTLEYSTRNQDEIFKKKRESELDLKMLGMSNGYIKCKPHIMVDRNSEVAPLPLENNQVVENLSVYMKIEDGDEDEEVDIEGSDDDVIIIEKKEDVIDLTEEKEEEMQLPLEIKIKEEKDSETPNENLKMKVKLLEKGDDDENVPPTRPLPSHGFLCLTPGIGFLELSNSNNKITIQHPRYSDILKTFNNIEEANEWINSFFRKYFTFEPPNLNLKWVVVTQGVLKLKKSKHFQSQLFNSPRTVITDSGPVQRATKKSLL